MASEIGWKTVELQIETLVPGILLTAEGWMLVKQQYPEETLSNVTGSFTNEFVIGAAFVAISYSIGLLSSVASRLVIDRISEMGFRSIFLRLFSHKSANPNCGECNGCDDAKYKQDLAFAQRRWWQIKPVARWNAIYRAALRNTTRKDEVDRRRSQGRLARNLFVPVVLAPFLLLTDFHRWLWFGVVSILMFAMYAYSEYINFAEASDMCDPALKAQQVMAAKTK